ncbi:MAG: hypothetical protein IJP66_05625, partial [Kiritimatiellae bacterium]|nr:hypothetical protein [Kiritimatiellia bacterium]
AMLVAGGAIAQSDSAAVSQAAANPASIHDAVAALDGITIQAFAAEVIDAIATKPQNPIAKVYSLVDASSNFLAESDESNLADVIVAMISNVPFEALPEWTSMMIEAVQTATADIEEAPYNKLVADVVSKIGDLDDYTDSDKAVVTSFAIKLLSRGVSAFDDEPLLSALAVVPPAYGDQVKSSLGDVLAGDYSGVLTGIDIIDIPDVTGEPAGGDETIGGDATDGGFEETTGIDTPVLVTPENEQPQPEPPPKGKPYAEQN